MKKTVLILLISIIISSCNLGNKKNSCQKEFRENLEYLRAYSFNKDETYSMPEVEKKIEYLEAKSGIKNKDQGNIIGKFIVTKEDILNWENWLNEECVKKSD